MTFTGRIRAYLIVVAVVPTLLVITVIYLLGLRQAAAADRQSAQRSLDRFAQFHAAFAEDLTSAVRDAALSPEIARALLLLNAGRPTDAQLNALPSGLDFLEILDREGIVLLSHHRPGLVGEKLKGGWAQRDQSGLAAAVEIDIEGPHAALAASAPADANHSIHSGRYLDSSYAASVERLVGAEVRIDFSEGVSPLFANMVEGRLYSDDDSLRAVLLGGAAEGFYVSTAFAGGPESAVFGNLIIISTLVALGSILLAVALGLYISGRAQREFQNLITATTRVAAGDLSTPVMAYEEGEFAQLADSFTAMTLHLKEAQRRLATTEKIAAWQAVGRKIAHEIKNPLTPIMISADDLRRSYHERLPDFPRILEETTTTIKFEVDRLTRILDEFVGFARMSPPVIRDTAPSRLLEPLAALYRTETDSGRLALTNRSLRRTVCLDSDAVQQVLVNLVKNGFETAAGSRVTVEIADESDHLVITVADTGPGFPPEILNRGLEPYLSTKKGGSGLGLVISQRIIHDHGGTMELQNGHGGALVTLRLPVHHG